MLLNAAMESSVSQLACDRDTAVFFFHLLLPEISLLGVIISLAI